MAHEVLRLRAFGPLLRMKRGGVFLKVVWDFLFLIESRFGVGGGLFWAVRLLFIYG